MNKNSHFLKNVLFEKTIELTSNFGQMYEAVYGAEKLIKELQKLPNISISILTGNLEKVGWWKLAQAGLKKYFEFGFFADEVTTRNDIAKQVAIKSPKYFGYNFLNRMYFCDWRYDLRC